MLIEKNNGSKNNNKCKNNPKILFTTKVGVRIPSGFSMSTISPFKNVENNHDASRCKDCIKDFCESLREHAMKIIKCLKMLSTKEQKQSYENAKVCYISKEKFENI